MSPRRSVVWNLLLIVVLLLAAYLGVRILTADVVRGRTADLSVSQEGPVSIAPGQTFSLTLAVSNGGSATARDVVVTYEVPPRVPRSFIFDATRSDPACVLRAESIVCGTKGVDVPAGESRSFTLSFGVPEDFSCGSPVTSVVSAEALGTMDADPRNNESVSRFAMSCPKKANLSIAVEGETAVALDGALSATLVAGNAGPDKATRVTASLTIPRGLVFDSVRSDAACVAYRGAVLCKEGGERAAGFDVAKGQTKRFTVYFTVSQNASCGAVLTQDGSVESRDASDARFADNVVRREITLTCAQEE